MKGHVRLWIASLTLGAGALGAAGCQTTEVGQVLPSGYHMRDDLFYAERGPQFPLQNELNAMQAAEEEREGQSF